MRAICASGRRICDRRSSTIISVRELPEGGMTMLIAAHDPGRL